MSDQYAEIRAHNDRVLGPVLATSGVFELWYHPNTREYAMTYVPGSARPSYVRLDVGFYGEVTVSTAGTTRQAAHWDFATHAAEVEAARVAAEVFLAAVHDNLRTTQEV